MKRTVPDRYAVIGNPIAHSKSPLIHGLFAQQTGQAVVYGRLLAPRDGFAATVSAMRAAGMRGANVTVPFKFDAHAVCQQLSPRALAAGAVNTLIFDETGVRGDNTDGAGLVADLQRMAGSLQSKRIVLLGAGGASAGVARPLIDAGVASLTVLNRTASKAHALVDALVSGGHSGVGGCQFKAGGFDAEPHGADVIINATSTGLTDEVPSIAAGWYDQAQWAYDMMYGAQPTAFMRLAQQRGLDAADGLGMLVGQAAVSFEIWRGVRPDVEPVLSILRSQLQGASPVADVAGKRP